MPPLTSIRIRAAPTTNWACSCCSPAIRLARCRISGRRWRIRTGTSPVLPARCWRAWDRDNRVFTTNNPALGIGGQVAHAETVEVKISDWLLADLRIPKGIVSEPEHHHPWWQVMCLTGVDYFSTLGYQPGIAFLAAGLLSPVATLILVLLTLFGALPIYNRVAKESPNGEGSISMLEHLLSRWKGKLFVLALLGFVATDFVITITLSAADATAHVIQNPYTPHFLSHRITVTMALIALLGAIFLKGFKEAIGIAVALVGAYLFMNVIVVGRGLYELLFVHPEALPNWYHGILTATVNGISVNKDVLVDRK